MSESGWVASESAVVTAYVVTVRAPIEGYLSGISAKVGDPARHGSMVARIDDPRMNDQRLVDLRQLFFRSAAERRAIETLRASLLEILDSLRRREADYGLAVIGYASARVVEAERLAEAKLASAALARRDLARRASLGRDGFAASADVDRIRSEADVADREAAAAGAGLAALRRREESARRGVFVESGSNDVAYSSQRADDVSLRLSEVERSLAFALAAEGEAAARLAEEERRVAGLRSAEVMLPANGMIWKLLASDGERIAVGDSVAELVDCGAAFVAASVPQDRVPQLAVGAMARVRISGETADREGRVLAVTGDERLARDRNIAAAPASIRSSAGSARIAIPPSGNVASECLIGRTARVLLPTLGNGTVLDGFGSLLSRFF